MKHNQTLRRGLSVLLALVMCLSLLPATALAEGTATASADFTTDATTALARLNDAKTGDVASTWDSASNTLTLNGVNFTTSAATAVKLPDGATIVLTAGTENTITSTYNGSADSSYGISATGGLTIEGSGKLTVAGGTATGQYCDSRGIYAAGAVTISGGTVTATGGKAGYISYGIYAYNAVTISGGTVTATGGTADFSYGIRAATDVTISGGTVTATGGTAKNDSFGIHAATDVTISGGTVTATGGTAENNSCGIRSSADVTISGSAKVTATGATGSEDSNPQNNYGIHAANVTISGSAEVTATGGEADSSSNGIYAGTAVTISGGTVTATGGEADCSIGLNAYEKLTISGGHVTAQMLATTATRMCALSKAPDLSGYSGYYWRAGAGDGFADSKEKSYTYNTAHTYVEFTPCIQTADFTSGDGSAALALLNAAKTGETDSTWADNTLTLNGVNFTTSAATAVKLPENATIVLAAGTENTITSTYNGSSSSYGISATGGLTIEGSGKLTATGGTALSYYDSRGIYAAGAVTISGGTVTATGGTAKNSFGIYASNVTISGGTVTATGGTADFSYGIRANKDAVTISGGTVTATGGTAGDSCYGIYAAANIAISDGRVEAASGAVTSETGNSCGIYSGADVTISGSAKVTATGATGSEESKPNINYGISTESNVTISGSAEVTATGGEAGSSSNGIYAHKTVTISGGRVEATGGTAESSSGIYAYNTVTISGGTVTSTGDEAGRTSYGIYASNVSISGGHVTAKTLAADAKTKCALNMAPNLDSYSGYYWRTSASGDFNNTPYSYSAAHTYVEFSQGAAVTTYTVSFNPNGGSGEMAAVTVASGSSYTLPECGFTAPEGKQFKGWATSADGDVISGTTITVTGDITLYAIWEDIPVTTYTVRFNANGGTGTMADVTGVSGSYTLPDCKFTAPEGKQFKGWATSADGDVISGTTITVTENITLYAIWEDIPATTCDQTADFTLEDTSTALNLLNAAKTEGADDSTWDSATKTLTLKGVNFTTSAATAVKLPADTTIVLAAGTENTITNVHGLIGNSVGIQANGNITIQGSGTLTVTAGKAAQISCGIHSSDGNVTIKGGTVTATGGETTQKSWGSCGIDADGVVTISGGTVTATGGKAVSNSRGIYASTDVNISGTAKVDATGGTADNFSCGIHAEGYDDSDGNPAGGVTISGGTVTATGGTTGKYSDGIYAYTNVTISGGTVNATGGETTGEESESFGICADVDMDISGGTVTAKGGTAGEYSYGICSYYNETTISGGTVNATGGKATGESYGILADTNIMISGGSVTATGSTATDYSFGIFAYDNISISDTAEVTATGGEANESFGIESDDTEKIIISGGHVIAQTLATTATTKSALNVAPNLDSYSGYQWRTSASGDFNTTPYTYSADHTYVEFSQGAVVTTYTVRFNANGGTGEMAAVTVTSGENYTLPECGFTAPEGKQFKGWATSKDGEVISGTTITVTANITLYAIWANIPATTCDQTADFTLEDTTKALNLLGGGSVAEWDSENQKLTLKGVNFTTSAATAVKLPNGATIVLAAGTENTITSVSATADDSYGIYAAGSLTIEGSGTLTVTGGTVTATGGSARSASFGIYAENGNVDIQGGTVTATSDWGEQCSRGIYADGGDVRISGEATVVTATGGETSGGSNGIYAASSYIDGSFVGGNITILSGTVTALGGTTGSLGASQSCGICANRNITISGGTVKATGGTADDGGDPDNTANSQSKGIYANLDITISGGTVTATGGDANDQSCGIYTNNGSITISGGEVTARTLAGDQAKTRMALNKAPDLSAYAGYKWRTSPDASFTTDTAYPYSESDTYVEFSKGDTATTYTVTFNPNGGTLNEGSHATTKTEDNGTVDYLAAATREGYTFDGWYTAATGGEKVYTFITVFTADTTVYAHWTDKAQTKQITAASFTMTGYTLGAKAEDIVITSNTEGLSLIGGYFEALGKPYSYLLCVASDGDQNNLTEVTGSLEADKAYILLLKVDINAGYETSALTEKVVTLNSTINAFDCDADVIGEACASFVFMLPALTENDTPDEKHTVTFAANGGSGSMDAVTVASGSSYTLPECGFTAPEGKRFKAWSVNGTEYAVGASITVNADTTVTAIWEDIPVTTYTVHFDANGGTGTMADVTVASGSSYTLPACGFKAPEGKQFKAWSVNGTEYAVGASITVNADTTVTAIWEDIPVTTTYTVTVRGSYAAATGAGAYEAGALVVLAAGSRSGYTFSGWTSDDVTILNANRANASFIMPAKNVTVTANWTENAPVVVPGDPVKPVTPVKPVNPFRDVPAGAYYEDAVIWAVNEGITSGTTGTTFSPDASCTRAQAVTFLWRAAGSPAPKSVVMPFTDVAKGSYYYDAVLWALEQGITNGTSDTTFSPDATCTRAQIVTFLWRSQNAPDAGGVNPFRDVADDAYYAEAILWAAENGITGGTTAATFSPDSDCTRAQIVTFLYRLLG